MNAPGSHTESRGTPIHPFCNTCGWRKGGVDSWDGRSCKCGHYEPPFCYRGADKATVTYVRPVEYGETIPEAPTGMTAEEAAAVYRDVEIAKSCAHGTDPDALTDEKDAAK